MRSMLISNSLQREAPKALCGYVYILVALLRVRRTRTLVWFQEDHDQLFALFTSPFVCDDRRRKTGTRTCPLGAAIEAPQISCNDRTSDACLPVIGTDPPSNQKYILLWRSFMLHLIIRSMRL
jgi:hypothetical protein